MEQKNSHLPTILFMRTQTNCQIKSYAAETIDGWWLLKAYKLEEQSLADFETWNPIKNRLGLNRDWVERNLLGRVGWIPIDEENKRKFK